MPRPDSAVPAGPVPPPRPGIPQPAPGQPLDPTGREVLSASDIARCLRRIGHEILEANKGSADLVLLGIPSRGVELARRLAAVIAEVEGVEVPVGALDITFFRDDLRSQPTRAPLPTVIPRGGIDGKVVVLVDDVLYSGRTVRAALDALADHVGKNLPTSNAEKVQVRLEAHDGIPDVVRIAGGEVR